MTIVLRGAPAFILLNISFYNFLTFQITMLSSIEIFQGGLEVNLYNLLRKPKQKTPIFPIRAISNKFDKVGPIDSSDSQKI